MDLATLTYDSVKPLEGAAFRVALADGTVVTLSLDGVLSYESRETHRTGAATASRRSPFALCFSGPRTPILPQAMYTLRGDAATFEQLFIVPVGQDRERTQYEAVFT
jgi:hypothetical protein